jgi:hypothetical protein
MIKNAQLHVRLIEFSINFDYTKEEGKVLLVILADFILINRFQLISNKKNLCFPQLTSQSDQLIAVNRVWSIKVNQMQNTNEMALVFSRKI